MSLVEVLWIQGRSEQGRTVSVSSRPLDVETVRVVSDIEDVPVPSIASVPPEVAVDLVDMAKRGARDQASRVHDRCTGLRLRCRVARVGGCDRTVRSDPDARLRRGQASL